MVASWGMPFQALMDAWRVVEITIGTYRLWQLQGYSWNKHVIEQGVHQVTVLLAGTTRGGGRTERWDRTANAINHVNPGD
jgi:hypothetical protein